ncbi:hypothetical protein D7231_31905 [Streptomyces klenkii]|uniref:Uncharacterized protein n=1 Tax=Streptomyces klenkii TaxID=1420899 RepID=A0A3B0AMH9_9ACTN|nr:hypothetical protein [Streptomyces klenkii]RKN61879.1 hypothetical protein D7231_31905 [Streptomyces klenkii]
MTAEQHEPAEARPGWARRAADRLWDGSRIVGRRTTEGIAGWVRDGDGVGDRSARLLFPAGAAGMVWLAVGRMEWLLWFAAAWWCAAAYRATAPPKEPSAPKRKRGKGAPAGAVEEAPQGPAKDPLLALVEQLIGTANGVHVAAVLQALQRADGSPDWGVPEVRAALEARGVRVRPSLKVAGRVSVGVHRDDLTAALAALPDPAPSGAPGQVVGEVATAVTSDNYPRATEVATPGYPSRGGVEEGLEGHFDTALRIVHPRAEEPR